MCISKISEHEYKCCCGCPLICGVVIIFVFCLFSLASAITWVDIFGIVVYGILTVWFITSFVRKHSHQTRHHLYHSYLLGFIITLIYTLWYCFFSGDVSDRADEICKSDFADWFNWSDCDDDVDDFIWVFVGIYLVFMISIRLYFVRVLYYYAKEIEPTHDRPYHKLDEAHHHDPHHGHQPQPINHETAHHHDTAHHDTDHHHDHHVDNHDHGHDMH